MNDYNITVKGMTCASCASSVSHLLRRRGFSEVGVNHVTGQVNFKSETPVVIDPVFDAIDGLGYQSVRAEGPAGNTDPHQGHDHSQEDIADKLLPLCVALTVPLLGHMFVSWPLLHNMWFQLTLATPVFLIGWWVFGKSAIKSLQNGWPNMNVLIILGATAAYLYSLQSLFRGGAMAHQYLFFETTASIITLVMVGNWLEHRTVKQTTKSIDALTKLQPQTARLVQRDSLGRESIVEVEARYLRTDDLVRIAEGEALPADGILEEGSLQIDERMITGEAEPADRTVGQAVTGGTIVVAGSALVRTTAVGSATVLSRIVQMVRDAQGARPPLQKLADKIAGIFVPAVLGISLLTLLLNYFLGHHLFAESMSRAIAVLVISCPCAMGLATPAAIAVGLGRAARMGILVKGGDTLEQMKRVKTIVFDKTGTLTTGNLRVGETHLEGLTEAQLHPIVTGLERHSAHPIAKSIVAQWRTAPAILTEVKEEKGAGMTGTLEGKIWRLGKRTFAGGASSPEGWDLYLSEEVQFRAALRLEDHLREDASETIQRLHAAGYETVMLSGDRQAKCDAVAAQTGIHKVWAEQTPEQKASVLDTLLKEGGVAMVGDGINDAPSLARATVGISLSEASQIAVQSAQVILSANKLSVLPAALKLGIYTERTIKSNLFWAFLYNIVAIPIAAVGLLSPTWGAGVMALSDVVLVLNSLYLGVRRLA
jgi:Cu+-exporting ATPase